VNRAPAFPPPSKLPAQAGLPDPLVMFSGGRVAKVKQWVQARKPELALLFRHYMYGFEPPPPSNLRFELLNEEPWGAGVAGLRREYRVTYGPPGTPPMDLLVGRPDGAKGAVPLFVGANFGGNGGVKSQTGPDGLAWPAGDILGRGFGFATFHCADVDPDRPDFTDGVHPPYFRKGQTAPAPNDWGTIAAWAWGLSRAADALIEAGETVPALLAVTGHSRLGKTALLAAALDSRFALCVPNQAGCGGSAPSRGIVGESVASINEAFPHWFNDIFPEFGPMVERLPFDQHSLVALVAPRPVLFLAAEEDQWANPAGQFGVLRAAEPVYRLLGARGLAESQIPPLGTMVGAELGYRIRPGKHSMGPPDWADALSFASTRLTGGKS